jgi:arginase
MDSKAKNIAQVGHTAENLMKVVSKEAAKDDFVLILGGDHCIPIGTISGIIHSRPNTGIVWVDAHADINTPEASNSGNMHGMPLGLLLEGLYPDAPKLPGFGWLENYPRFKPEQVRVRV